MTLLRRRLEGHNTPMTHKNNPPSLSIPHHVPRPPTSALATTTQAKQLPPTPPKHHMRDLRAFPMPSPTLPPSTQVMNSFHVGESVVPVIRNNSSPDSMPPSTVHTKEPVDVAVLREQLERAKYELYKESLANHSLRQAQATLLMPSSVAPTPGPSIVTPVSPATPSQAFSSTPSKDKSDSASVSSDKSGKSSGWFGRSNSQSSKTSSKAPAPSSKSPTAKKDKATAKMLRAQTTIDLDMF
ncbi:hypothetical protein BC830DRAFT_51589 [Chytriomyces sp. MP71]|nr:hypothetical protein BC830DRAFT_51589 [Chytriomyces sp. MP71]